MFTQFKRFVFNAWLLAAIISLLTFTVALAASGDLDTTFSGDGLVTTNFPGRADRVWGIAIQSNGKIVVAGRSWGTTVDFGLARYNANGSLDPTFSGDGRVITNFGRDDTAYDVALQSNGKIIAVGETCNQAEVCNLAMVRYNASGALDTTFSGDGKVVTDIGGRDNGAKGVTIQPDGKIVVVGYAWNGHDTDFVFYRYNTNGSLDTTFSGDGMSIGNFGVGRYDYARDVAIQSDGKIVGVGYTEDSTGNNFSVARLNANGTADVTFSGDGRVLTNFGGEDRATSVALQTNGKIVVAGNKSQVDFFYFAVARYNPNGSLDTTFNGTGKKAFSIEPGVLSFGYDVLVQPNGKIVVAGGSGGLGVDDDFALARLNPNGSLDNTFSGDGRLVIDFCGGGFEESYALARQPSDGKYVLAGSTNCTSPEEDFALARVLP